MARMEAQQEMIIELLMRLDSKVDSLNNRLFYAAMGLLTIAGAGLVTYLVNTLA